MPHEPCHAWIITDFPLDTALTDLNVTHTIPAVAAAPTIDGSPAMASPAPPSPPSPSASFYDVSDDDEGEYNTIRHTESGKGVKLLYTKSKVRSPFLFAAVAWS